MLRQGIAELLNDRADLRVVGEAADGNQAIELARALLPDVIVMDMQMPAVSGFEATRRIRAACPAVKIVILSAFNDEQYVYAAIQAGASGYVMKTARVSRLEEAIRAAHAGQLVIEQPGYREMNWDLPRPAADNERMTGRKTGRSSEARAADPPAANAAAPNAAAPKLKVPSKPLSGREQEVLRLLARGCNNHEIGEALHISTHTVEAHISHVLNKLRVKSRLNAVLTAVQIGLLSIDS